MVIFVVGLCIVFIVSSVVYFVTKQLLDMKDNKKMPDPPVVNPDTGDGGGGGNPQNPDPGDK